MSYEIPIKFCNAAPKSVFRKIKTITDAINANIDTIISENKMFIPTNKYPDSSEGDNEAWLHRLTTTKFLYWEQYRLLGFIGCTPKKIHGIKQYEVFFQNSTDQDYEYESWPKLKFFTDIINEVGQIPYNELAETWDICDDDELDEDYLRKSVTYEYIYNRLDLEKFLCNIKNPNFELLCTTAIGTSEQRLHALIMMKKYIKSCV